MKKLVDKDIVFNIKKAKMLVERESPEVFAPEDYVDAFNWIVINLKCNVCYNIHELVNMELS